MYVIQVALAIMNYGQKHKEVHLKRIQWVIWFALYVFSVVSMFAYSSFKEALAYSASSIGVFAIIIYTNAAFLLPRLYEKNRKILYIGIVLIFLVCMTVVKTYLTYALYRYFKPRVDVRIYWTSLLGNFASTLLIYVSSVLFYMALNYFRLRQKQEQLQKRQAESELNLLKAQVQPHFLFNTLNNIYFVAHRESPATASLLERLSLIMRYFVDEAPKDKIKLHAELDFIKSYIELEKMRMRYPLSITVEDENLPEGINVPPMLLIPLVENVFKHGIDKRRSDNFIYISLAVRHSRLLVTVENRLYQPSGVESKSETGLRNLTSRLELLFGENCTLQAGDAGTIYQAKLNIPI